MRSLSKIIKAAELQILVPNEAQTVIPVLREKEVEQSPKESGAIFSSANLLEEAELKAQEIVAKAEAQAEALLSEAETQIETLRLQTKEAAFDEGYQEGLKTGEEQALHNATGLLSLLQATVDEGVRVRASSLQALEDDFLKFSLLLADKIVKKTVSDDISWLAPIIDESLTALGRVEQIILRLNPVDYSLLQEHNQTLLAGNRVKISFESDEQVSQGGCLIESENGLIDARLEKRFEKIAQHLMEVPYYE